MMWAAMYPLQAGSRSDMARNSGRKVGVGLALCAAMSFLSVGTAFGESLEDWLKKEEKIASQRLMESTVDAGDGHMTFVASAVPSDPSYKYHWVRDAAGVMRSVLYLYQESQSQEEKEKYFRVFQDYLNFSRKIQVAPNPSGGVGEPKFNPDGTPFLGDWARPQSDGPASRAIVLTSWAEVLLREGREDLVRKTLYDSILPTNSLIKTDLEYIANNWQLPSYDLWEEAKGDHFYTLMMERRALLAGAKLAQKLEDPFAADWYSQQAKSIEAEIELFWDSAKKIIVATRNAEMMPHPRESGLDTSILLGVLLGHTSDEFMTFGDERVLATVHALEDRFKKLYPINRNPQIPGIAVGRYPEDRYDGFSTQGLGNPWVPMTASFAQFYERLARMYEQKGAIVVTAISKDFFDRLSESIGEGPVPVGVSSSNSTIFQRLVKAMHARGDAYLSRIQYHAGPDGSLSEQMNRDTGYMQGAQHLAVSYTTVLWATWARRGNFPSLDQPSNP